MTLAEYLRVVRTHWMLIAAVTVLGALAAATFSWLQTPIYQATARMFVTTSASGGDIGSLQQGSTFTQQRVKSYAQIMTSPKVLEPVVDELDLAGVTLEDLADQISASSPLDTVLLDVSVEDASPQRASDIANAVARQFTAYVTQLELPTGSGTSPVKVTVTQPAVPPTVPESPRKTLNLALGLLIGLGLGLGTAILRDSLDRTISTRHDAGEIAGAPVLSTVLEDSTAAVSPLIIHDAFSARAEAFRQLRTNIRFLSVDHEVRSLVVTSSLAGEGKTMTATNLAIAMAQSGQAVVLIDADLRRPSIGDLLSLPSGIGLTSVLVGDAELADAVQQWRDDLRLFALTSGPLPPNPSELIGSHRMSEVVDQLVAEGYLVIVDSPPLLPVTDAAILARITSGALLVTRAKSTRIEQLAAAADALRTAQASILGVVVNRVPRGSGQYSTYDTYSAYTPLDRSPDAPAEPGLGTGAPTLGNPAPLPPTTAPRPKPRGGSPRKNGQATDSALPVGPPGTSSRAP